MAPKPGMAPKTRRTQQERRTATQAAIMDAALECLVEVGLARFTTTEVCRRAGVSQGALFKYHDSKSALLAATVGHLFDGLVRDFESAFSALVGGERSIDEAFELLWDQMLDERLWAAYELYTAARTDPGLQADLEPVVEVHSLRIFELAGSVFADTGMTEYGAVTSLAICAIQGLLLNQMARPNAAEIGEVHRALRAYAASLGAGTGAIEN